MAEISSRWAPTPGVRDHTGQPLAPQMVFFAAPPDIGTVLTAHSGVYRGASAMNGPMARKIVGLFALGGAAAGGFLGACVTAGAWPGVAAGTLLGGGVTGALVRRRESGRRDCTFVGTHGAARVRFPDHTRPFVLRFADAVELQTAYLGRNMGTHYDFRWRDARGKTLYRLVGGYYGNQHESDADSVYHFARSAERAWCAHLLPQVRAEIQRQGFARFLVNRALSGDQYAHVGPGYLELFYSNEPHRLRAGDIEDIVLHQGVITIRRRGATPGAMPSMSGRDGVYYLRYGAIANVSLFLQLLEQVVGVPCRGADPGTPGRW